MGKAVKGRGAIRSGASLLLIGTLAAACAPAVGEVPNALPPAQVRITPGAGMPSGPTAGISINPSATSSPGPPQSDIARVAFQLFGDRLIERISIPDLHVDSTVVPVGWHLNPESAQVEWDSPDEAVGWMISSALPGQPQGNTVLYGHNNMYTSVFRDLGGLAAGDLIYLYTPGETWKYRVSEVEIFPVSEGAGDQGKYLAYLDPTPAPRLTLISCWPPVSNTHRVVVIAEAMEPP